MKFKNFLIEKEIDELEEIKNNCKQFLKIANIKTPLYRGIQNIKNKNEIQLFKTNKNRRPINSSRKLTEIVNNAFVSVFGIKLRSECIFCSGDSTISKTYGSSFIIIPKGNFKIYWSDTIHDFFISEDWVKWNKIKAKNRNEFLSAIFELYLLLFWFGSFNVTETCYEIITLQKDLFPLYIKDFNPSGNLLEYIKQLIPEAERLWVESNYNEGDLLKAIKSHNEIMLICDEYYIVNRSNWKKLW